MLIKKKSQAGYNRKTTIVITTTNDYGNATKNDSSDINERLRQLYQRTTHLQQEQINKPQWRQMPKGRTKKPLPPCPKRHDLLTPLVAWGDQMATIPLDALRRFALHPHWAFHHFHLYPNLLTHHVVQDGYFGEVMIYHRTYIDILFLFSMVKEDA